MPTVPSRRALVPAALALALLALTGCAPSPATPAIPATPDGEGPVAGAPPTSAPTVDDGGDPLPSAPVDDTPIVASWDPAAPPADLGDGRVLLDCEGDAPTLCVVDDGTVLGVLEEFRFPVPDELAGVAGMDLDQALRAFAAARVDDVAADRAAGCGPGHEVLPDAPGSVLVAGQPGLRYGFAGVVDGAIVERVVTWATLRGDELRLVVAAAVTPGACMDDGLTSFTHDVLGELLPTLDRVVAGTPLPA